MNNIEVQNIRKKFNKTQTEFGDLLGVKLRTVQSWEKEGGKIPLTAEKLLIRILVEYENTAGKEGSVVNEKSAVYGKENVSDKLIAMLLEDPTFREGVLNIMKGKISEVDKKIENVATINGKFYFELQEVKKQLK